MRLLTFHTDGKDRLGVLTANDTVLCLSRAAKRFGVSGIPETMLEAVTHAETALPAVKSLLQSAEAGAAGAPFFLPLAGLALRAPYKNPPRNIICVGLN